ncbi:hypothetical protein [Xenorhabdus stockiae]|uniref:hypothetical protein n=1 Tax=Xenorhabdus stockiae TaxID=351614 RepID=UPI004062A16D
MDVGRPAASLGNRYALTQVTPRSFRDVYPALNQSIGKNRTEHIVIVAGAIALPE